MKKVLVTGGAGFIGFHLSKYLADEKYEVTIIDNFSRQGEDTEFRKLINLTNVKFIKADMTSKDFYTKLDGRYDFIYHLAAINGTKFFYEKPYEVLRVNILTLMNLLEWVNKNNCGKFMFSSSSEAYAGTVRSCPDGRLIPTKETIPLCVDDVFNARFSYGGSKIAGELLVINYFRKYNIPYGIVRYSNIYGPRMGFEHVTSEFCKRIYNKENPFNIFGAEETRAFCYISDAVLGTILVMENNKCNGEIINIGNSLEEIKIIEMLKILFKITNYDAEINVNSSPKGCVQRRCPDISKLQKLTGYKSVVSLKEGLKKTVDWYFKNLSSINNG